MANILLTGANGFVGSHLLAHLSKEHRITAICYDEPNAGPCPGPSLDLRKVEEIDSFLDSNEMHFDALIHLAFILATDRNAKSMDLLYENLRIMENMVRLIKKLRPRKLINFSSIAVYPNTDGRFGEKSEIRPSVNAEGLYGLAKFCSENIFDFFLRDEEIIISHLRISQIHGQGMRGDRIMSIFKKELEEKNTITVFGDGERVSNFINIGKVISVVDGFLKEDLPGIFNVGDEDLSYAELAERLIKKYGNRKSRLIKVKKGNRSKFFLDLRKLSKRDE